MSVGHITLFSEALNRNTYACYMTVRLLFSTALPELLKTRGQIVVVTSAAAHLRAVPLASYCISKHSIDRLGEFVALGK